MERPDRTASHPRAARKWCLCLGHSLSKPEQAFEGIRYQQFHMNAWCALEFCANTVTDCVYVLLFYVSKHSTYSNRVYDCDRSIRNNYENSVFPDAKPTFNVHNISKLSAIYQKNLHKLLLDAPWQQHFRQSLDGWLSYS